MQKIFDEIINKVEELSKIENFERNVNYRPFEIEITKLASSYKLNNELKDFLINNINKESKNNKKISFILFFVLFTMARRQNYLNILELADEYNELFADYEIMKHIRLMAVLEKCTNTQVIYREIKKATVFVETKNELCDFTVHTGVLNAYVALICKYFEYELDERETSENLKLLRFGLASIEKAIKLEKEEKGSLDLVYNKFFLNRGRILILLEKYAKGEEDILKAIELLPPSTDRESKVNEYNQYLVKSSIIRAYDLNQEKVRDLDKIKVSNYKSIALMTTLLGFLLGTINIFTTISDRFTLAILMLGYLGLLLVLVGTILLGFSLNFRERKKRLYVYDILLIIVGVIIFVSTMIIINKG